MFSFLYHWQDFYRTLLYIWVTRRVSYKKQENLLFTSTCVPPPPSGFWLDPCCSSFLCCPVVCLCVLDFVLLIPLRFPHVWFVFISSCLLGWGISCLRYLCPCGGSGGSGVQHILYVGSFFRQRLVCPVLPSSLDFSILIPSSVIIFCMHW